MDMITSTCSTYSTPNTLKARRCNKCAALQHHIWQIKAAPPAVVAELLLGPRESSSLSRAMLACGLDARVLHSGQLLKDLGEDLMHCSQKLWPQPRSKGRLLLLLYPLRHTLQCSRSGSIIEQDDGCNVRSR